MSLPSCSKNRAVSNLRKRTANLNLGTPLRQDEECFNPILSINREIQEAKKMVQAPKYHLGLQANVPSPFLQKPQTANSKLKNNQIITGYTGSDSRNSAKNMNILVAAKWQAEQAIRPNSSYGGKLDKASVRINNISSSAAYECRPGSSKSSRSFKRRGSEKQAKFNAENNEDLCTNDFFVVTKTKTEAERSDADRRRGVSTSSGQRQKKAIKLDPQFLNLFAN